MVSVWWFYPDSSCKHWHHEIIHLSGSAPYCQRCFGPALFVTRAALIGGLPSSGPLADLQLWCYELIFDGETLEASDSAGLQRHQQAVRHSFWKHLYSCWCSAVQEVVGASFGTIHHCLVFLCVFADSCNSLSVFISLPSDEFVYLCDSTKM